METYTFTHTPDPAILRRDLVADRNGVAVPPTFAAICEQTAAEFRTLAQEFYDLGDQHRGDRLLSRALAWECAARSGDLADVRP